MDMLEGVGRRSGTESLLDLGLHSLNGREHNGLFRNNGDGTFHDVGWLHRADRDEDARGMALLDYDRDGRLDLAVRNYRQPAQLLRNAGDERHWVFFELEGRRSNRDAVGARIRLRAGDAWQTRVVAAGSGYLSGSSLRQHFGLGDATRVDEVRIDWPSGLRTTLRDLRANRVYRVVEQVEVGGGEDPGDTLAASAPAIARLRP
ncbi:MAG: CRTAC1 family protein [Myxococcota bacterium]|nr:CRTAC1 family protein [Myxococcota bacterium]